MNERYFLNTKLRKFFTILLLFVSSLSFAQMTGKEFWLGFTVNHQTAGGTTLSVEISSDVNTSGSVSIPLQGWNSNFSVGAGGSVTVNVPSAIALCDISEEIQQKGILIKTQDNVSVSAANFQMYTSDATIVLPNNYTGSRYFINGYQGFQYYFPGEFVIVAQYNSTEIEIIPTSPTQNGNPAKSPIKIVLNRGQTYLVQSLKGGDLSGTKVTGTDPCKPFSVYAASPLTNIPQGCAAGDLYWHQMFPVELLGNNYFAVPINGKYTLRVMAVEKNTTVNIGGTPSNISNEGNFITLSNQNQILEIVADKPVLITQFLQGHSCTGFGDPGMTVLTPTDKSLNKIQLSIPKIDNINDNYISVYVRTQFLNQFKHNSVLSSSGFTSISQEWSYNRIRVEAGYHLIEADSGIIAYAFGTGTYNSYIFNGGFKGPAPLDFTYTTPICAESEIEFKSSINGNLIWTINNSTQLYGNTVNHIFPLSGIYTVSLSNCRDTVYKEIEVFPVPDVKVTRDTFMCGNNIITIEAKGNGNGNNYQWSNGSTNSFSTFSEAGVYYLKTTNDNCSRTDSIIIHKISYPIVNAGPDVVICENETYTIEPEVEFANEYIWSTGEATEKIFVSKEGQYIVEVSNYCGTAKDSIFIKTKSAPLGYTEGDTLILLGNETKIKASGGSVYQWLNSPWMSCDNCPEPIVSPQVTTTYFVFISNDNGCTVMDSVTVEVDSDLKVFIPNIFSPNGDGNNDILFVRGKGIKTFKFSIFNRWGEKIFETEDLNKGWDGTFRGEGPVSSVYVYYLDAYMESGQRIVKKGDIALLK